MNKILSHKGLILLFVLPSVLLFACTVFFPVVSSFYYSTLEWDGVKEPIFIKIKNYGDLLGNANFLKAIVNSVKLALLSVFVQLPIAFILARVLSSGVKGEGFFRSVYFIPVVVSTVVIGQLWLKIYNPQYGLLNEFLGNLGLERWIKEWISNPKIALSSVFVPLIWQHVGYHTLLFYAGLKNIPKELIEAAKVDGASPFMTTVKIIIPNLVPVIEICVILAVIGSLKTFDLIYIITNGGPLHATEVPTIMMYNTIFHRTAYGSGSAIAVFIILECLLFTVLIQSFFKAVNPVKGANE